MFQARQAPSRDKPTTQERQTGDPPNRGQSIMAMILIENVNYKESSSCLEVQGGKTLKLLVYSPEYMIVKIPCLVKM